MTASYLFVNPPLTPLMVIRAKENLSKHKRMTIDKRWKSYRRISPHLLRAVLAAEDTKFPDHDGFDWEAIEKAQEQNERRRGKRLYGASTISMQTAKNVFLWPSRSYVRKALEAYFTVLIELLWTKKRILEVYVNVIEWGDGIYGAEAAARNYFGKSAAEVTEREAALMAAVLPNPRRWSPAAPTWYIERRCAVIQSRMDQVTLPK
jgi:monofunctional biosynthetic peptidoglycan transglycosylase